MKKLFLCHYSRDAAEVYDLALELRLRGIVPWVDKHGGFLIGDSAPDEARRAIREDCFGLLLYATPQVFERPFIRDIEIPASIQAAEQDKSFALFAIPRRLKFIELSKLSQDYFGFDISQYHTQGISEPNGMEIDSLVDQFGAVARMVLRRHTAIRAIALAVDQVSFQFSTRELLPCNEDDLLQVDATSLFQDKSGLGSHYSWDRVAQGLLDIKTALSQHFGRPHIKVHGSKHLTAAYLLGRIFCRASGFNLDVRQREEFWSTDARAAVHEPFIVTVSDGSPESNNLIVEISATGKNVFESVHKYFRGFGGNSHRVISFTPKDRTTVDNNIAVAMAMQIRRNLEGIVGRYPVEEIHLFSAVPQGLALMIGHNLNALPPIQLYEFDGVNYYPSYKLPAAYKDSDR